VRSVHVALVDNLYDEALWIRGGALANKYRQVATTGKLFIPVPTAKQKWCTGKKLSFVVDMLGFFARYQVIHNPYPSLP